MKLRLASLVLVVTLRALGVSGMNTNQNHRQAQQIPPPPVINSRNSRTGAGNGGGRNTNQSTNRSNQSFITPLEVRAETTQVSHKTACQKYNAFVGVQRKACKEAGLDENNYKLWDDLLEEDVCGPILPGGIPLSNDPPCSTMMAEFANYLLNDTKKNSVEPYAPYTTLGFYSSFKAVLFKKFKPLGYRTDSPDWYEHLYRGLRMRASVECIKRGGKLKKKAVGMSLAAMKNSLLFLLKQEGSLGYEERAIIVTLYHAVGRASEVDSSVWESASWDADRGMLTLDWGESKKGVQYAMTFHPQALESPSDNNNQRVDDDSWLMCWFHSMACFLLCGPRKHASPNNANYLFAAYTGMAPGGAASKVTRILTKCSDGNVEDIPEGMASHGLRVTASDVMMFNHLLAFMSGIARGGWDCAADTLLFFYITNKKHVASAGRYN